MSSTAVQGQIDGGIHRRIEHIKGIPISLATRGRHTATAEGHERWREVINQGNPAGPTAQAHLRRSTGGCNPRSGARRRARGAPGATSPQVRTQRPPAPAPWYGFSEAAVVTIGGVAGGALVAWEFSVMLVKLLTRVFDPAPSVPAVSVGYLGVAVLAVAAALMAALASAHTSARLAVEELREL
jgi:hypothetical protein